MRPVIVRHVYPPIPDRRWDWLAVWSDYDDDPECRHPVGRGPTLEAAIADLQIETEMRDAAA
jgi:hypothetical protein